MKITVIDPLAILPEELIFADLDNKGGSVSTNSSGVTSGEQSVSTNVWIQHGNEKKTLSAIACKIDTYPLGSAYAGSSTPSPAQNYRVSVTPSTGKVTVYVKSGTTLTNPVAITITLTATIEGESVSRDVTLTISGSRQGPPGGEGPTGPAGNDAERYWIEMEGGVKEVRFSEDFSGVISGKPASAKILIKHLKGSDETTLSVLPTGYTVEYLDDSNNWETLSTAASLTRNMESDLSDGAYSPAVYRLRKGNTELMRINIHAVWEYQRMLMPAGKYTSKEYTRTSTTTPLVLHESSGEYWFLDADTNKVGNTFIGPKDANQQVWKRADAFDVVLAKMLFAQFAQFGGFIVYDNFFFSRYGTLISTAGTETAVNQANVSTQYSDKVPYAWFDPSDPMAAVLPGSGYKFRPSKCINALTGEEWCAGGNIHFSPGGDVSVKGALMASKVSREELLTTSGGTYHYLYPYTVDASKKSVRINGNYIVVSGKDYNNSDDCDIFLPPARLFEGMELTILFAGFDTTKHRIPFNLNVARRLIDSEDDELYFDTDAAIEIYNTDYVTTNGFCLMCDGLGAVAEEGAYKGEYLSCDAGVSMIRLVAAAHPWSVWTSGDNKEKSICWAVVDFKSIAQN